jgi:hypothetical protein
VLHQLVLRFFVSVCVTAIAVGCAEPRSAAREPLPPPAVASEQLQPKPPPPEKRETKVQPLDSDHCTTRDATLIDFTKAQVTARCDNRGPTTRVLLTVQPRTTDPADYFRDLSLRFCGDVIDAEGSSGWQTRIDREKGRSEVAADVTWELSDAPPQSRIHSSDRVVGFAVSMRESWRRGLGYSVSFKGGGIVSGSPHDCPYPFK